MHQLKSNSSVEDFILKAGQKSGSIFKEVDRDLLFQLGVCYCILILKSPAERRFENLRTVTLCCEQLRLEDDHDPRLLSDSSRKRRRSLCLTPRLPRNRTKKVKAEQEPDSDDGLQPLVCTPQSRMSEFKKAFMSSLPDQLSPSEKLVQAARAWSQQPDVLERKRLRLEKRQQAEFRRFQARIRKDNLRSLKAKSTKTQSDKDQDQDQKETGAEDDVDATPDDNSDSDDAF